MLDISPPIQIPGRFQSPAISCYQLAITELPSGYGPLRFDYWHEVPLRGTVSYMISILCPKLYAHVLYTIEIADGSATLQNISVKCG